MLHLPEAEAGKAWAIFGNREATWRKIFLLFFSGLRSLIKKTKNEDIIKGRDTCNLLGCLSSHGQISCYQQ